jgi:hypothetical protein
MESLHLLLHAHWGHEPTRKGTLTHPLPSDASDGRGWPKGRVRVREAGVSATSPASTRGSPVGLMVELVAE